MNGPDQLEVEREAALAHHRAGELDVAEAAYQRIAEQYPGDAETFHLLGILRGQQGDPQESVRLIQLAIQLDGTVGKYYGNLGVSLQALAQDAAALEAFKQAAALDTDSPEALFAYGACLEKDSRSDEAVATLTRAVELAPDFAAARLNLGVALHAEQRFNDALSEYDEVLRLDPGCAEAHANRGIVLLDLGDTGAAIDALETAVHLAPDNAEAFNDLGCALRSLGKHDMAIQAFRRSLELLPQNVETLNNLGNALQELGQFTDAVTAYRQALLLQGDDPIILASLAEAKTFAAGDADFGRMLRLLDNPDLVSAGKGRLLFALAKACEDMGNFEQAFTHFEAANKSVRGNFDYDVSRDERHLARIVDVFNDQMFKKFDGYGSNSERPIFILGMPRSGTSLVEQILASHPDVFGAGELPDFQRSVLALAHGRFPEGLLDILPDEIAKFSDRYLDALNERHASAVRVTDKLPANFLYVGLIYAAFPQARVIHTVRDPLDTCLSCYRKSFANEHKYTYELRELGRYYKAYASLMAHWERLFPARMFEFQYEAVISEPEVSMRRLLEFCGLEWDEACMRFHQTERPVQTASAAQVRRPLYTDSIGAWRRYADHLAVLRAELLPVSAAGQS